MRLDTTGPFVRLDTTGPFVRLDTTGPCVRLDHRAICAPRKPAGTGDLSGGRQRAVVELLAVRRVEDQRPGKEEGAVPLSESSTPCMLFRGDQG